MAQKQPGCVLAVLGVTILLAAPASADLAAVAVDNHSVNTNGVMGPPKNASPDHVAIVDTKSNLAGPPAPRPPTDVGTPESAVSLA
jgi:hypothetical protein